jgi:tight adherence protein B
MMPAIMKLVPLGSSLLAGLAVLLTMMSWRDVWDRIANRYVADLMPTIRALNIDEAKIPTYLRAWGGLMLLALGTTIVAPPLAVAAVFFVYIMPRAYLKWLISRRRVLLRDQLVGATEALANTTRAGLSLSQGLDMVSKDSPRPLADELGTIVREFDHGLPLHQAIENTKERLNHDSFTLFAASLLTSLERGGRITEALERISKSLQENQRLERKMESETASGKRVLMILAVFPLLFILLFLVVFPEGTLQLLATLVGQIVLLVVIGLVYASVTWGQRILTLE